MRVPVKTCRDADPVLRRPARSLVEPAPRRLDWFGGARTSGSGAAAGTGAAGSCAFFPEELNMGRGGAGTVAGGQELRSRDIIRRSGALAQSVRATES